MSLLCSPLRSVVARRDMGHSNQKDTGVADGPLSLSVPKRIMDTCIKTTGNI